MKKRKILTMLVMIVVLIGCFVLTNASAAVTDSSFIAAPEKTLVQGVDYEYSFAVLGDTQCISLADAKNGTSYTEQMFNWIKNNKENKNIQYVLGLGDITNTFKSSDTYYTAEWQIAKDCYAILDEAGISYSLVRGNHDISSGMNSAFGTGTEYYNSIIALSETTDSEGRAMGGFLGEYTDATQTAFKIENSFRKITAGEDKWLIVTLDWAPSEEALTWLSGILELNPDYRAIITLHQFLQKDGAIIDDPEGTLPHENIGDANWGEVTTGGTVHPRTLWDRVLSKYANVEMILAGHVPVDDIVRTQYRGDNGNTVTCMLIDPQEMDEVLSTPVGMVAMFYFSADGNVVNVEYISTVRDSDGNDATNAYRGANNQFSMQLEYADGWVKTEYGYVPKTDYDNATFLTFLDDDGDANTESVYLGAYEEWVSASGTGGVIPMVRTQFTLGGASIRQKKTLSVLMLKDYDGTSDGKYSNIGDVCGTLELDLNGKTFTNGAYPLIAPYARTSYTTNTFKVSNGNVIISKAGGLVALQTSNANGNNGAITVHLANLNVSYASGATSEAPIVTTYPGNASYTSTASITVTNCNIDAYNNAPESVTLFSLADTNANNFASVIFNGGSITASSESAVSISKLGTKDSFVFGESDMGYTSLILPTDKTAPTQMYKNTAGKNVFFKETSRNDSFVTYALEENNVPAGSLGTINVWLIGGQSNASGYAIDTPTDALSDTRFANGFEDVLYYGAADDNVVSSFVPVKIGLGKSTSAIGAEIGIASMLSGSGMNAVIKLGRGSSYLYPDTSNNVSKTYGTWTSPSYISANNVTTDGTNIGRLYEEFIRIVTEGLELLEAEGYTPVIRGMWWMQGEAEMWREALALEYENLLTAFINDIRSDLSDISGDNLANMPFVIGIAESNKITDENGAYVYNQPSYDKKVGEAQRAVASKVHAVSYVETEQLARRDQWHFIADAQQYLGEEFVKHVIASEGKYSVTVNGESVSMTGGGAYEAGSAVTVKITAENGFVITKITLTVDGGESYEINLGDNGIYSFTMPEANVSFNVDSYDPNMIETVYGTIPSQYSDVHQWPFAVFHDGNFYNAYATWNDVLKAGASILTAERTTATLLLRRDYSTSEDKESLQDLYTFEGKLYIDLGNHTLTRGSYHLFQIMAKKTTEKQRSTDITIMNGTIETQGSTPFVINTRNDALADHFYFEFNGVTFKYTSGSTVANMIMVTYTNGTVDTEVTALFRNCVFDLAGAPSCTIFNLKEDSGAAKSAYVTIENSEFRANQLTGISLYSGAETDSFILSEGVTFILPTGYNASAFTCSDSSGLTYALEASETAGDKIIYVLKEAKIESDTTAYGEIPAQYSNETAYPFAVFDQDKNFIAAYAKWDTFLSSASKILTSSNKKAYLLVRRDYGTSENSSSSQNWYTFAGSIEIDLDGHTITIDKKSHLFQLINKCTKETETNITISNGTIVTYLNYAPFVINGHANSTANYTVNLTCNNVNFVYHKSSTVNNLVIDTFATGTTESNLNAVFNDCVFDVSNASKVITIFNVKESSGTVKAANITVNGGSIITGYFSNDTVCKLANGDSISFGKGADGNYLSLTAIGTATVTAPTSYYTVDGNDAYFHKVSSTDTETVYTISVCEAAEGTHACSCGNIMGSCADGNKDHLCDVCGETLSECADGDNDHLCDLCSAKLSDHDDSDSDHVCNICGNTTPCADENKDHSCDVCGNTTTCEDKDNDHICDLCDKKTPCTDENNNHYCDLCMTKLTECADEDSNHKCDVCDAALTECADEDSNHKCDVCDATLTECADGDNNHKCDVCDATLTECADGDNNHYCDLCGTKLTDCTDGDNNHKCDVCNATLTECADNDNNHKCDVCDAALTECADGDNNHKCDVCGATLTECADGDNNHKCDVCGTTLSECKDNDRNHKCDVCGATLTECADNDKDHKCDLCKTKLSTCADDDTDHFCDVCETQLTNCTDRNKDHFCDVCETKLTDCKDNDKNHVCDICETKISECADEDNNHKCDLCDTALTECADGNADHICDLCEAKLTDCTDVNSDHNCDLCGAALSECADKNNNHKCDVCGTTLSECIDANNDHKCDICASELTKCTDENKDHVCDLCGAETSKCADKNSDHKCDICEKVTSECADANGDDNCDVCGVSLKTEENKSFFEAFIDKILNFFAEIIGKIKGVFGLEE